MSDFTYADPKVDKFMSKVRPWLERFFNSMVKRHGYERGKNKFFLEIFLYKAYLGEKWADELLMIPTNNYWR